MVVTYDCSLQCAPNSSDEGMISQGTPDQHYFDCPLLELDTPSHTFIYCLKYATEKEWVLKKKKAIETFSFLRCLKNKITLEQSLLKINCGKFQF